MTVGEWFIDSNISFDDLEAYVDEKKSSYWTNALGFIEDNWGNEVDEMSFKQQEWFHKILTEVSDVT